MGKDEPTTDRNQAGNGGVCVANELIYDILDASMHVLASPASISHCRTQAPSLAVKSEMHLQEAASCIQSNKATSLGALERSKQ